MNAVVIASILGSIAIVASSLAAIYSNLNTKKLDATKEKVDEIHVMVNSRLDQALAKIEDLKTEILHEKIKRGE